MSSLKIGPPAGGWKLKITRVSWFLKSRDTQKTVTSLLLAMLLSFSPILPSFKLEHFRLLGALTSQASYITWTGAGEDGRWSNPANWSELIVPDAEDIASFNAASSADVEITNDITVGGIEIDADYTGTIEVTSPRQLTVGAEGFTQNGGTFSARRTPMAVRGSMQLNAGTFIAPATSLTVGGNLSVLTSNFNHNNGTVVLDGIEQIVFGSAAYHNFVKKAPVAQELVFQSGSLSTFDGNFHLAGTGAGQLTVRASTEGVPFTVMPQDTITVDYVDVQDSVNSSLVFIACSTCRSLGNVSGWDIPAADSSGTSPAPSGEGAVAGSTAAGLLPQPDPPPPLERIEYQTIQQTAIKTKDEAAFAASEPMQFIVEIDHAREGLVLAAVNTEHYDVEVPNLITIPQPAPEPATSPVPSPDASAPANGEEQASSHSSPQPSASPTIAPAPSAGVTPSPAPNVSPTPEPAPSASPAPAPSVSPEPDSAPSASTSPITSLFKPLRELFAARDAYAAEEDVSRDPAPDLLPDADPLEPDSVTRAELIAPNGQPAPAQPLISKVEGETFISLPNPGKTIRPGKYTLEVAANHEGRDVTASQDFTWGVLAVNLDQSTYQPQEEATIGVGVLDDYGTTICDADVTISVTDPNGQTSIMTTEDGTVAYSDECSIRSVTDQPDYYASYQPQGTGEYDLTVTAETRNGTRFMTQTFEAATDAPFVTRRTGGMRIYPPVDYTMNVNLTANQDFTGTITEPVPGSFTLKDWTIDGLDDATITLEETNDGQQLTTSEVSLTPGQIITLSYTYKAPLVTPEFYLVGPLTLQSAESQDQDASDQEQQDLDFGLGHLDLSEAWNEPRAWQIAADAFPQVVGSQLSSRASNAVDDTVNLPASVASGDLLIVFHFAETSVTRTFPGSWVEIKDAAGATETIGIAYLIASGGETSVTVTKSTDERFAAIAIRISAASWHGTTAPEVSTGATGTSNTPDPDSVTASWGSDDNLFIAAFVSDAPDTTLPVSSWPTNYSSNQLTSAGDVSSAGGAIATRELASDADNPGTFTMSASETWWAGTVVVRPAAGGGGRSRIMIISMHDEELLPALSNAPARRRETDQHQNLET